MRSDETSHNRLLTSSYYLDSNAWISIENRPGAMEELSALRAHNCVHISVANQNLQELFDSVINRVPKAGLRPKKVAPHIETVVADSVFVVEFSQLDHAQLGVRSATNFFGLAMGSKNRNRRNVRDAIHLVNARSLKATLVTCDTRLRATAKRGGVHNVCVSTFLEILNLRHQFECASRYCHSERVGLQESRIEDVVL